MADQQTTTEDKSEAKAKTKAGAPADNNGQQRPQGLQAMTERDVNDYMATLIESQKPPPGLEPLELGALTQYRGIAQQQGNTERRLTRAQNQVEQLKAELSRFQGQSEAYVNLLVYAEDMRRAEGKQTKPKPKAGGKRSKTKRKPPAEDN